MRVVAVLLCCLCIPAVAFSQQMVQPGMWKDTVAITGLLHPGIPFRPHSVNSEHSIPQNFYTQHLGFFCRQELKMQEVHVPVTFRLGSMDNCNWLEQKPGYR